MAALLARLIAAQRSGSGFGAVAEVPLGCLARLQRALGAQDAAPGAGRGGAAAGNSSDGARSERAGLETAQHFEKRRGHPWVPVARFGLPLENARGLRARLAPRAPHVYGRHAARA